MCSRESFIRIFDGNQSFLAKKMLSHQFSVQLAALYQRENACLIVNVFSLSLRDFLSSSCIKPNESYEPIASYVLRRR
jgi:hypothetical protein